MRRLEALRGGKGFWIVAAAFYLAEAVLGLLLQISDDGMLTRLFSYGCVLLACAFCLLFVSASHTYLLTQAALLCTVGADWFLVMREPREQLFAMCFFLCAQLAYFLRLYLCDPLRGRRTVHLILRAAVTVAAILLTSSVLGTRADAVAIVSVIYYAHLLLNIVFAFLIEGVSFFSVGLVLFALCDALIGIACIDPYLPLPVDSPWRMLLHPGFDLAWAFYVPSQALIASSPRRHLKKEG